jgi:CheY-like chemotaxis protein
MTDQPTPSKCRILLVEDNDMLTNAYMMILERGGNEVVLARNGKEALVKLKSFSPHVILLDMLMPEMDGLQFMKKLKSTKQEISFKIIILTNLGDEPMVKEALSLGASDYVLKAQMSPTGLLEKIEKATS